MSKETATGGVETQFDRDVWIAGAIATGVGTMIAAGIVVLSGLAVSKFSAARPPRAVPSCSGHHRSLDWRRRV